MTAVWLGDDTRVKVASNQVSCDLGEESAILNLENGIYFGLDPVGARIWNLIHEPRTVADLQKALLDEYEVDASCLHSDIRELLVRLAELGLIEIKQ